MVAHQGPVIPRPLMLLSSLLGRPLGLYVAGTLLVHLPVVVFAFLVLAASSIIFLALYKPWNVSRSRRDSHGGGGGLLPGAHNKVSGKFPTNQQWARIGINGLFHALVVLAAAKGLQVCGTVRFLLLEPMHLCMAGVASMVLTQHERNKAGNRRSQHHSSGGIIASIVDRVGANGLMAIAVLFLLWPNPIASSTATTNTASGGVGVAALAPKLLAEGGHEAVDGSISSLGDSNSVNGDSGSDFQELGLVSGIALLLGASLLKAVRERFAVKLAKEVGGSRRLHALSVTLACIAVSPLLLLDLMSEAIINTNYNYSVMSMATILDVLLVVLLLQVLEFSASRYHSKVKSEALHVLVTIPWALVLLWMLGNPDSTQLILAGHNAKQEEAHSQWINTAVEPHAMFAIFAWLLVGLALAQRTTWQALVHHVFADAVEMLADEGGVDRFGAKTRNLWTLARVSLTSAFWGGWGGGGGGGRMGLRDSKGSGGGGADGGGVMSWRGFWLTGRRLLRHIWSDKESFKIFVFLMLNLMFMFVEVVVGVWTNSLGLISDAGHMFFDCGALFIGLCASFVSQWRPDGVFTYGYGRFEVLSGFVNGVFLIFIAVFILTESLERIASPPELNTKGLLVTSVIGFLVNMVGLVFFHEHAHSHGDGESCGGGAHGHSHGGGGGGHDVLKVEVNAATAASKGHGHAHGGTDHGAAAVADVSAHGHSHGHDHGHGHGDESQSNKDNVSNSTEQHGHSHGGQACHGHGDAPAESNKRASMVATATQYANENMHGVFLHILADTLGSLGVIVSSLLIEYRGWYIADPICSCLISLLILASVVPLLRTTSYTLLNRPDDQLLARLELCVDDVRLWPEVAQVCEPHAWRHAKDTVVGSMQVVVHDASMVDKVWARATQRMREGLGNTRHVTVQVCDVSTSDALIKERGLMRVHSARAFMPAILNREANPHLPVPRMHEPHGDDGHHGHSHSSHNHGHSHGHSHDQAGDSSTVSSPSRRR